MNERDYLALGQRVTNEITKFNLGTITWDHVVERKTVLYPAIAKLLGVECECRTNECRGCEDVEEWIADLSEEDDDE